jgi:chemotaxis protein CheX
MDVKYINPFIMAAQSVFRTMLGIEVTLSKPVIKTSRTTSGEVTGIMGLVGDRKGTITISFQDKGALFIYKTLIGDESAAINSDVVDAIGELTNIISGQARKEFEKAGINLKAAIPMVIVGKEIELNFITTLPIVQLPFNFSVGNGTQEVMFLDSPSSRREAAREQGKIRSSFQGSGTDRYTFRTLFISQERCIRVPQENSAHPLSET